MQKRNKILIVDDSSVMRRIIVNILRNICSHDIFEMEDALECIKFLDSNEDVKLVILDLDHPFVDVFEVLEEFKEKKIFEEIKIIVCSVESSKDYIIKSRNFGANGYIKKPFDKKKFSKKVLELLG